jgi:F-type H+-transporting ATPase subunit delta
MKANKRTIRTARKLFRLCVVDGRLDDARVRLVAKTLAASNRRGAIGVLSSLQRMVRLERNRHRAVVESAVALTDDVRATVADGLARMYGSALETSFEQNPALIGGMRVSIGSDVYDGSIRARLAAIEARL